MKVDPAGLASVAQRIAEVLAEVTGGDPVHPPLGTDPAAAGAAARLSSAAAALVGVLGEQALGLATTASQLARVTAAFDEQDRANAVRISSLGDGGADAAVSGWAPPSPPMPPDIRPPLTPPPPLPAEVISTAVHSGNPNAGDAFITGWTRLALALERAAETVQLAADQLPEVWESPVSTDAVRGHLQTYSTAFSVSSSRARTLADQASRHVEQTVQARSDIPAPETFAALRQQIQTVSAANIRSGGAYAVPLSQLHAEKAALEGQTVTKYGGYHAETDATTAGDGAAPGEEQTGEPRPGSDPADGEKTGEEMSPEKAGEMASMLPQMISTVLGAAGGLLGGAVSSVGQVPQGLMQAAGQATQSLQGMMKPPVTADLMGGAAGTEPLGEGLSGEGLGSGGGAGGGGGGATLPASGGSATLPPSVSPSTGPAPTPPTAPAGGLPPPSGPPGTGGSSSGMMPMGMPLGGLAAGAGGASGGQDPAIRSKKVVTPPEPHTESVTGKVNADRIAVSRTARDGEDPQPLDDDRLSQAPKPVVRRITSARPKDDE